MSEVLKDEWLWLVIIAIICIILIPFVVVLLILNLPPVLRLFSTVGLVFAWAVAAAYKDWVKGRREEERMKKIRDL